MILKKFLDKEKHVGAIYNHLRDLSMRLHQRFAKADIDTEAKQRAKKRRQENCYKDTKEKHKRLESKCVEVVQRIAPNVAKMHEATINEKFYP